MSKQLSRSDVAGRLINYQRDSYLNMGSVMMGVSFAAGTIVLLEILQDLPSNWARLTYWFASLMTNIVSYLTWGRGTLLANSRGNLRDSVLPLLLGVGEFLLFAILSVKTFVEADVWRWWFFIAAFVLICAVLITHNRLMVTKVTEDFTPDLQDLGHEMLEWIKEDRKGAWVGTFVALALFAGTWVWPLGNNWLSAALAVPFILIFIKVIRDAEKQRARIEEFVFQDG